MSQTPVHDNHNPDLLNILPKSAKYIVEIGSSSGALAREYKRINISPESKYIGIEIDSNYAALSKRFCDEVYVENIEKMNEDLWTKLGRADCWVFGDTLEHLQDPWMVLRKIRSLISSDGVIACCIPNAQHWSLQVRLSVGDFRYEESGLLDKTHLRWFTRKTLCELFSSTGFEIQMLQPRIFNEPQSDEFISLLKRIAQRAGASPEEAAEDSRPIQYVALAKPI
jgi:ubiquinone/menaquinone biosynthesis C-methylase UbiE